MFVISFRLTKFDDISLTQQVIQQKAEAAVPSAELAKEVVDTVSPPKVDFATDLFDMLSMDDGPTEKVPVAASSADDLWAGFQCKFTLPLYMLKYKLSL